MTDLILAGELRARAERLFERLHDPALYSPVTVFRPGHMWPGDKEGRTVLALTLLGRLLGRAPEHLDAILRNFPKYLNAAGYFGTAHADGTIDEQQLSSHGWVLRGLCEYYRWEKDPKIREMAARIVRNLALPLRGRFSAYPLDPTLRNRRGDVRGTHIEHKAGDWVLSTDVGCAFILLDGLVQAQAECDLPEVRPLIEEMIARFAEMDLLAIRAQTHAALTAARGVLRYYEQAGRRDDLDLVERVYRLYRQHGLTAHYANYNWFLRPEWTEPCAIVDAFMLAAGLWRHTGQTEYLRDAHCIWHTALARSQRPNGGFGCDTCPRPEEPEVGLKAYEAFWCCTMRAAEGFFQRAAASILSTPDSLTFAFPGSYTAGLGNSVQIRMESDYPYRADQRVAFLENSRPFRGALRFFIPPGVAARQAQARIAAAPVGRLAGDFLEVAGEFKAGDVLELDLPIVVEKRPAVNAPDSGLVGWWHGPLMLGTDGAAMPAETLHPAGRGEYTDAAGLRLTPLSDLFFEQGLPATNETFAADAAALRRARRRCLFRMA